MSVKDHGTDDMYVTKCELIKKQPLRYGVQEFENQAASTHIQNVHVTARIEEDCSCNANQCTSTEEDQITMQTCFVGQKADEAQESDKKTGISIPSEEQATSTPINVGIEEDCSNSAGILISTKRNPATMQSFFVDREANEVQESEMNAGISNSSVEVIPQSETGDHSSSFSAMRSFDMMTERPRIYDKKISLSDAYLDQDEQMHLCIFREKIQQLEKQLRKRDEQIREEIQQNKQLREKLMIAERNLCEEIQKHKQLKETVLEQQIAVIEKNMTDMVDKQMRELKQVSIYEEQLKEKNPETTDDTSGANEDSQEANAVWRRDRLLVAHTGN